MIILYFVVGELIIQFIQREVIFRKIADGFRGFTGSKFISELFYCRKCLGFWVFLCIGSIFNINFIEQFGILGIVVTAIFTTYITYYASEGIKGNHQIIVVGGNGK